MHNPMSRQIRITSFNKLLFLYTQDRTCPLCGHAGLWIARRNRVVICADPGCGWSCDPAPAGLVQSHGLS